MVPVAAKKPPRDFGKMDKVVFVPRIEKLFQTMHARFLKLHLATATLQHARIQKSMVQEIFAGKKYLMNGFDSNKINYSGAAKICIEHFLRANPKANFDAAIKGVEDDIKIAKKIISDLNINAAQRRMKDQRAYSGTFHEINSMLTRWQNQLELLQNAIKRQRKPALEPV